MMDLPDLKRSRLRSLEICNTSNTIHLMEPEQEFDLLKVLKAPNLKRLYVRFYSDKSWGCFLPSLKLPARGYTADEIQAANQDCEVELSFPASLSIPSYHDQLATRCLPEKGHLHLFDHLKLSRESTSYEESSLSGRAVSASVCGHLANEAERILQKPLSFLLDARSLCQGENLPIDEKLGAFQQYLDFKNCNC